MHVGTSCLQELQQAVQDAQRDVATLETESKTLKVSFALSLCDRKAPACALTSGEGFMPCFMALQDQLHTVAAEAESAAKTAAATLAQRDAEHKQVSRSGWSEGPASRRFDSHDVQVVQDHEIAMQQAEADVRHAQESLRTLKAKVKCTHCHALGCAHCGSREALHEVCGK